MAVKLKVNQQDIARATAKLQKTVADCSNQTSSFAKYKFTILDEYRKAIVSVMGVVPESGGGALSREVLGESFQVRWHGLSEWTLRLKTHYGYRLEIWEASGETKRAVKVTGNFAGIDGDTDPGAYAKAMEVEFGNEGEYEARALFTVANAMILKHMPEIKARLKRGFIRTAVDNGWGR